MHRFLVSFEFLVLHLFESSSWINLVFSFWLFSHNTLWYQGTINIALDEMVKCIAVLNQNVSQHSFINLIYIKCQQNPQQQVVQWIELESDKLAPPQSITGNDREHLHKFFVELSGYVVRGQNRWKRSPQEIYASGIQANQDLWSAERINIRLT